eukprot:CAMPEP_0181084220 /NCGR_PEP_ID=MMETSP1071-20121207/4580_1 /TAXON_ID=35127 /ORGANISM="Thalassiosira sp., Strain NH16" /LENGTH=241 /DNA_ID=CAMNT_0023165941 /DNA_START=122 /DNA_END=847 /DNA_ORIENTATION=+
MAMVVIIIRPSSPIAVEDGGGHCETLVGEQIVVGEKVAAMAERRHGHDGKGRGRVATVRTTAAGRPPPRGEPRGGWPPAAPPSAEGGGGSSRFSSRFGTSAIGGRRDDDDGLAVRRMLNLGPSSFFLRDCAPPGGLSEKKSESSFSFVLQRLPPPLDIRLVDVPLPATASSCVPPASFSIFSTERLPYPNRSFRRWDRDDDEDDGDAPDLAPPEEEEEGGLSQRSGRFDSGDNSFFFALPS